MTKNSKIATTLSALTILTLGLTGAASAQQLMPTATNSELNGSWVGGSDARADSAEINNVAARTGIVASDANRGTWVDGTTRSSIDFGGPVALSYASPEGPAHSRAVASEFGSGTWVDGSALGEDAGAR